MRRSTRRLSSSSARCLKPDPFDMRYDTVDPREGSLMRQLVTTPSLTLFGLL